MAGGTFDKLVGKVRPGVYINFESTRRDVVRNNPRGTVIIPLLGYDYGPTEQFIEINSSAPDAEFTKLGRSVYDDNAFMLLIREALKNANKVLAYIVGPSAKAKATIEALTVTAKHAGAYGNNIKVIITANAASGFDVLVTLNTETVFEQHGVTKIAQLEENEYVDFSGTGTSDITATAGINLSGGAIADVTNLQMTTFLDSIENQTFSVLCFPVNGTDAASLKTALKTKIKYLREEAGRKVQAVVPDFAADYEGIINVTNSVVLDGTELTNAQACAFVAGISAGADYLTSNTYAAYEGASGIVGEKTHDEAVAAIKNGEFFFSRNSSNDVVVEYDINSLVTYSDKNDKSYSKNRVIRVFDSFNESLQLNFPPNKFNNDETGWLIMEGIGRQILRNYADAGAITNVDYDNDFVVDRSASSGDETYFNVGLQAVDSAEKLFFTIKTR